jgi:hypothetical protein
MVFQFYRHHLSVIGLIGKYFLVTGHTGVENDFAGGLAGFGKGPAWKGATVFAG